jgi:hypothetical protein
LKGLSGALNNHFVTIRFIDLGIVHFQFISDAGDVRVLKQFLIESLGVGDNGEEGIGEVGEGVVRIAAAAVAVLQVDGREDSFLDAGVFILDFDDPEGLVGAECDEEKVQYEFPGESIEAYILLEWTQGDPLHEVHLDDALLVLHYDILSTHNHLNIPSNLSNLNFKGRLLQIKKERFLKRSC